MACRPSGWQKRRIWGESPMPGRRTSVTATTVRPAETSGRTAGLLRVRRVTRSPRMPLRAPSGLHLQLRVPKRRLPGRATRPSGKRRNRNGSGMTGLPSLSVAAMIAKTSRAASLIATASRTGPGNRVGRANRVTISARAVSASLVDRVNPAVPASLVALASPAVLASLVHPENLVLGNLQAPSPRGVRRRRRIRHNGSPLRAKLPVRVERAAKRECSRRSAASPESRPD